MISLGSMKNLRITTAKSNKINNYPGLSPTLSKFLICPQNLKKKDKILNKSLMENALLSRPAPGILSFYPYLDSLTLLNLNLDNLSELTKILTSCLKNFQLSMITGLSLWKLMKGPQNNTPTLVDWISK